MSHSKNWIAQAIPSIDGSKTTLTVTGDVPSGTIAPSLVIDGTKGLLPPNVFALQLKNEVPGATIAKVSFKQDIAGKDNLDIVLVFNEGHEVVAAIIIDRSIVS